MYVLGPLPLSPSSVLKPPIAGSLAPDAVLTAESATKVLELALQPLPRRRAS